MKFKNFVAILLLSSMLIVNVNAQYLITKDGKSPFVQVVKDIRESVVNVRVDYEVSSGQYSRQFPFDDDFFKFFFLKFPIRNNPGNQLTWEVDAFLKRREIMFIS